ncbi:conserved hypothetical protein [Methanocaldococcus sp. FS406-22]|uniref:hypothetical protein n=1 Tax=Methanocaldococcus sp. (strain FS406-22) TaxID=644281 RepID=UPI0001BF5013|nr:hypothetical protein [Methanocaldococcus sp. FS406-22]ADC69148.1 conserved hypothetical protein [Methanocaldococcus sp. FS406-22]
MEENWREITIKNIREINQKITRLEWLLNSYKNDREAEYINKKINELRIKRDEYIKSLKE